MRLIDADAVGEAIKEEITEAKGIDADPNFTAGLKLGLAYINTAPTSDAVQVVDAVPVVRCMDCKYRKVSEHHYKGIRYCVTECTIGNEGAIKSCVDSGYCSLAERKEKRDETD